MLPIASKKYLDITLIGRIKLAEVKLLIDLQKCFSLSDQIVLFHNVVLHKCDAAFKTRNCLTIHKGKLHKETTKSTEKLRES